MIILDTNVLSASISAVKSSTVIAWLNSQVADQIWITAITVFETRMGIELLAVGRKRNQLESEFEQALSEHFGGRVLPFDTESAHHAGMSFAKRQCAGLPMDIRDAQIAGIAIAKNATLATRNIRDFTNLGMALIDPWTT